MYLFANGTVFENTLLSNSEKARISQILFAASPGVKYLKKSAAICRTKKTKQKIGFVKYDSLRFVTG